VHRAALFIEFVIAITITDATIMSLFKGAITTTKEKYIFI